MKLLRQCCKFDIKKINYLFIEHHENLYNDFIKMEIEIKKLNLKIKKLNQEIKK